MLTVVSIIVLLIGMLLPALSGARERGKQIGCQSNLHQIGLAILVYAGDYQNHTPPAFQPSSSGTITWYSLLLSNNYASTKVFQCPDDRRYWLMRNGKPVTPRSYAMVIGYQNTASSYNSSGVGNFWIAGSRLTCPYLTNSSVAMVAEYYVDSLNYPPNQTGSILEDQGAINPSGFQSPFVTSSYDYTPGSLSQSGFPPMSRHTPKLPLTGNYLFLDGHVEYVNSLAPGASYSADVLNSQLVGPKMFPPVPTQPNAPTPFVPCP